MGGGVWWAAVHGVAKSQTRLSNFTFTFHFHALEKEMATHSSVLAWRVPGTGKPGGLPSMGSHRVGHDWNDLAAAAAAASSLAWTLGPGFTHPVGWQQFQILLGPDYAHQLVSSSTRAPLRFYSQPPYDQALLTSSQKDPHKAGPGIQQGEEPTKQSAHHKKSTPATLLGGTLRAYRLRDERGVHF